MQKWAALTCLVILVQITACTGSPTTGPRDASPSGQPRAEGPRAPKILTVAVQAEPATLGDFGANNAAASADDKMRALAHNFLVVQDERDAWVAQLAVEQLSVEKGTWRINPNGTMDTIWKIHPGVRWHDGTPFTSADLLFAFNVYKDPALPTRTAGRAVELMESATAPDPYTLEIRWSRPYYAADRAQALYPLPRHLLEEVYLQDKDAFASSPRFTFEFVGLGPYKLARWEPGSMVELTPSEHYFRGRAPLDSIVLRFIGDPTAMTANILAGAVDAVLPIGVRLDEAMEVKQRWEGTGNQVVADLSGRLRHLEIQHRAEYARPVNGLTNRQVRQAFYHALDRRTLVDVMNPGLNAPFADSWIPPTHELRAALESAIPQFPYDPSRAQQLLSQQGWVRSGSGPLTSQATGEPFNLQLWNTQSSGAEREMNVVADSWKVIGAQTELYIVPAALVNDREGRAKLPGLGLTGVGYESFYVDRLHTRTVTAASNRWLGSNRGGYSNPVVDELLDRMVVSIAPAERLALHKQLLAEQMGDVALMPVYWDLDPILLLKSVRGVAAPNGSLNLSNTLLWDKE